MRDDATIRVLAAWKIEGRRAAHYRQLRSALEHVRGDIRPGCLFEIAEFACRTGWGHTKARQVLAEAAVYGLVVRDSVSPARFFFPRKEAKGCVVPTDVAAGRKKQIHVRGGE